MFGKERLVFDPAAADETDNVGVYLRASDGTLLTHTDLSGKKALDVNLANASIVVTATNLDIRDLAFATDKVDVGGSVIALDATTLAALESVTVQNGAGAAAVNIQDGGNSITVDGTVSISGDVNVTQGTSPWVVSATDLDIRDLTHVSDSVKIGDGTDFLAINADGSINVNADISVVNGSDKAEDAAHASGDIGTYILGVRQDTLANSVSADGDYASFKVNAQGALYVEVAKNAPASHTSWLVSQNTVTTTAELIVATDLANRKKIVIQNASAGTGAGSRVLYLGHSNAVTSANGIRISAGAGIELELAAGAAIYAIAGAAGTDVRVAELAG